MGDCWRGTLGNHTRRCHKLEKGFHGIDFSRDSLWDKAVGGQIAYEVIEVLGGDGRRLGNPVFVHIIPKLSKITFVSSKG